MHWLTESWGNGHFVLGIGYQDNETYEIMDPWYYEGYKIGTFDQVCTDFGSSRYWQFTLVTHKNLNTGEPMYPLTKNGGTGSKDLKEGQSSPIKATPGAGQKIVKWSGAGTAIDDSLSSTATITMGVSSITVTAVYEDISILLTQNDGELFIVGKSTEINWNPDAFNSNVHIRLKRDDGTGNLIQTALLGMSLANDGSFTWNIDDTFEDGEYFIVIEGFNTTEQVIDTSDTPFKITRQEVQIAGTKNRR